MNQNFVMKNDYERLLFRFLPKKSHLYGYSFNNNSPITDEDVARICYSCELLRSRCEFGDDRVSWSECKPVFRAEKDNQSVLRYLDKIIQGVLQDRETRHKLSHGAPGTEWYVSYHEERPYNDETKKFSVRCEEEDLIHFEVWNTDTSQGYRFDLSLDEAEKFGCFLREVNQHMLKNSEEEGV